MSTIHDVKSEERLIPVIRAKVAERLASEGFKVKDIARALKVTQPAVTQYLKHRRGAAVQGITSIDALLDPLEEKLVKRIRSGLGGVETSELLDTARALMVMSGGLKVVRSRPEKSGRGVVPELLRRRLELELTAAEKYLELANQTSDDHTKLLLRMIASDSIRHGDVVSQILSWLEAGSESGGALPDEKLLRAMLSIEDSAGEASLRDNIQVDHPVVRLLLEWIDFDEYKHEKIVSKLLNLNKRRGRPGRD
ncbi:MAG: hypothetical protein LYZ69_01710 [Nitrososphaerales archaeon]|nr:hypothetical protein [Nitrososphaerales archaeon]